MPVTEWIFFAGSQLEVSFFFVARLEKDDFRWMGRGLELDGTFLRGKLLRDEKKWDFRSGLLGRIYISEKRGAGWLRSSSSSAAFYKESGGPPIGDGPMTWDIRIFLGSETESISTSKCR